MKGCFDTAASLISSTAVGYGAVTFYWHILAQQVGSMPWHSLLPPLLLPELFLIDLNLRVNCGVNIFYSIRTSKQKHGSRSHQFRAPADDDRVASFVLRGVNSEARVIFAIFFPALRRHGLSILAAASCDVNGPLSEV